MDLLQSQVEVTGRGTWLSWACPQRTICHLKQLSNSMRGVLTLADYNRPNLKQFLQGNIQQGRENTRKAKLYRKVQIDFTPEAFYELFEKCLTKNIKRSLKQHIS